MLINHISFTAFYSPVSYLASCRHTWNFGVSSWISCVKCFDNIIYICLCGTWNSRIDRHSCEICCTSRLEISHKKCYHLFLITCSNWNTWWNVLEYLSFWVPRGLSYIYKEKSIKNLICNITFVYYNIFQSEFIFCLFIFIFLRAHMRAFCVYLVLHFVYVNIIWLD